MRGLPLLPLLCACMDHGFNPVKDEPLPGEGPRIEVDPSFIDFGTMTGADEAMIRSFTVSSVGDADLHIASMTLGGDSPGSYTLLSSLSPVLSPGASETIDVSFVPIGAESQAATVLIESDDESHQYATVELVGAAAVPLLQISPDPLDFGEAYIGCSEIASWELSNVGADTLVISDLQLTGDPAFELLTAVSLPMELAPGEATWLDVQLTAAEEVPYTAELSVSSNEPLGTRLAPALGEGTYGEPYLDEWVVPSDPPSDIFFAVDQSCSMDDDQTRLANNFDTFIDELSTYSSDWQIAVSNADDGCFDAGPLTESTSSYDSIFGTAVRADGGDFTEALLTVAARAMEKAGSSGCNAGFLREDAMLHVILVSDEPEQSAWLGSDSWDVLVDRIIDAKGSASMTRISAIAGPPGGGSCAEEGSGYLEAVEATEGVFLNLCSEWATPANLALLAEASVNQDTYLLEQNPVVESIEVRVNGDVRSTWDYDPTNNAVVFTEDIPTEGDTVQIEYAGLTTCD
jgi:hypothetical protein